MSAISGRAGTASRWAWRLLAVAGFALAIWLVYFLVLRGALGGGIVEPLGPSFTDVPQEHPYRVQIEKVVELGIMEGADETTFSPAAPISRGDTAKVVVRTMDWPVSANATVQFADVESSADLGQSDYIAVVSAKEIMTGTTDSPPKFLPDDDVTLGQLIVIAVRAGGEDLTSAGGQDAAVEALRASRSVKDAVYVALANNLLDDAGIDLATVDLGSAALREQVAVIILNLRRALGR